MNEQKAQRLSSHSTHSHSDKENTMKATNNSNSTKIDGVTISKEEYEYFLELKERARIAKERRTAYDKRPERQEKRKEYNKKSYEKVKTIKAEIKGLSIEDVKHLLQLARAQTEVANDIGDDVEGEDYNPADDE